MTELTGPQALNRIVKARSTGDTSRLDMAIRDEDTEWLDRRLMALGMSPCQKSASEESDSILEWVTSEKATPQERAAAKILLSKTSSRGDRLAAATVFKTSDVQASLQGEVRPSAPTAVSASDVNAIGGQDVSPEYINGLLAYQKQSTTSAREKASAGEQATKAMMVRSMIGAPSPLAKSSVSLEERLQTLEKCLASGKLTGATAMDAGNIVSFHRLRQGAIAGQVSKTVVSQLNSTAQDERDASNAEVRAAQTRPGISGAADARAQIQSIVGDGRPPSLSDVQGMGSNKGYLTAGGRTESDPVVVAAQLEDELVKSTDPRRRAEAGEALTYMRLAGLVAA